MRFRALAPAGDTRHSSRGRREIYAERFSDPDGRIRATFSFIWMSGWAPDASQQKPLKPGSAEVSLAKILGAKRPGLNCRQRMQADQSLNACCSALS